MPDIAPPSVELLDLCGVAVEAEDPEAHLAEPQDQREPDIAQADDADGEVPPDDLVSQATDALIAHRKDLVAAG